MMKKRVGTDFYVASRRYTEYLHSTDRRAYEKYVASIDSLHPKNALDVGCGVGTAVGLLRARGHEASGCDVSPMSIQSAQQAYGPYFQVLADPTGLPYGDASFAAVGCINVLEHVDDPSRLLSEMCRVLSPDGALVIFSPNMLSLTWPRRRGAITNPWLIRLQNAVYLTARACGIPYPAIGEFVCVENAVDESALAPDEDAICLVNAFDLRRALRRRGFRVTEYSATQRFQANRLVDVLYRSPLGVVLGAVCVTARRV